MKLVGILLLGLGLVLGIIGLMMDTTVATESIDVGGVQVPSQRVQNIGLLDERRNFLMGSGLSLLIGVILIATDTLRQRDTQEPEARRTQADRSRQCPHCAETIKAAAVVCRYCGRDVEPVPEPRKGPTLETLYSGTKHRYDSWERLARRDNAFVDEEEIAVARNTFVESFERTAAAYESADPGEANEFARSVMHDFPGFMEDPRLAAAMERLGT